MVIALIPRGIAGAVVILRRNSGKRTYPRIQGCGGKLKSNNVRLHFQ